jgi:DnaK suppressor protein
MTDTERRHLKTALEAKRQELRAALRDRLTELSIEAGHPDPLDWVRCMDDRDAAASMVNRFSVTLAEVTRSLRLIDEDSYGNCSRCERPIAVKRLQIIPWAAYCVRCQEQIETDGQDSDEPQAVSAISDGDVAGVGR